MLIIIAEYPNKTNIRDGMMLRINEIDKILSKYERVYLDISLFRKQGAEKESHPADKVTVYHVHFLADFFFIAGLLKKASLIYTHSILNFFKILLFVVTLGRKKRIAIDLHGEIPQEIIMEKSAWLSIIYLQVEKLAFRYCSHFIHVTHAMRKHYLAKYPPAKRKEKYQDHVLGIFTSFSNDLESEQLHKIQLELNWQPQQVWFIYSGGTQKWQNVDLMLQAIQKLENPSYRFLFLTGHYDIMRSKIEAYKLSNKITLRSVAPTDLKYYYSLCHYGFLLRSESIVNKVSNPTKLTEYLAYGMIPVLLSPWVGDYHEMGIESIGLDNLNQTMEAKRSQLNIDICNQYLQHMQEAQMEISNLMK